MPTRIQITIADDGKQVQVERGVQTLGPGSHEIEIEEGGSIVIKAVQGSQPDQPQG